MSGFGTWRAGHGGAQIYTPPAKVIQNGVTISAATVQSGFNTITSTGAFGVYGLAFPIPFLGTPAVVAWISVDLTSGAFAIINLVAFLNTGFQFQMGEFTPGFGAIPAGRNVTVAWVATGAT